MPRLKLLTSIVVLFVLFYLLLISSVFASSEMWSQTYGGSWGEGAYSLVKTLDGGFALLGGTGSFDAGNGDFWLVKTDKDGNIEWNQTYGGYGEDTGYSLVQTRDGGYALSGSTLNFGAESHDMWLIKTDANGNVEWNQTYGGPGWEKAYSLIETSDGGFAMAGETYSNYLGNFLLVKTDAYGNMEWNQTYGGGLREIAYSLVETSDEGYAMTGYTWSFSSNGKEDFWLVKTDAKGNLQWYQSYGGAGDDVAYSLVETFDGGYAIAGQTNSFGDKDVDVLLVKTNAYGNMEWNRTYGGADFEGAYSLVQLSDGGFALAGYSYMFAFGDRFNEGLLVKTDFDGNLEWSQTYGNNWGNSFESLVESSGGGFVLAGNSGSYNKESEFWLIKVNESGYIPEFPSWTILPVIVFSSFIIMIIRKKVSREEL